SLSSSLKRLTYPALTWATSTIHSGPPDSSGVTISNYDESWPGEYTIQWSETSEFWGGKGWEVGSTHGYSASGLTGPGYSATGTNGSLLLYGTTTANPGVEYFIVEDVSPTTALWLAGMPISGTVTADDSVYDIYEITQTNDAGVQQLQYWNVRQTPRDNGAITRGVHFSAWAELGMPLGDLGMQVFAVKGEAGDGAGSVVVRIQTVSGIFIREGIG
ncbi:concanavalin A-like lectin/glucanase domain-containing protein, partial [Roridomyces roridus]